MVSLGHKELAQWDEYLIATGMYTQELFVKDTVYKFFIICLYEHG